MTVGPNNSQHRFTDPFDNSAYNLLFNELYTPLCRFSMKFVLDKRAAEDIVQDLFLYLWENWSRLGNIASLKSYAFTAVRNRSINYLKQHYAHESADNEDFTPQTAVHGEVPLNPHELVEYTELVSILEKALETLPSKCRTIFTMKRFGELSHKEVAESLQISVKTVEAQMTIAIRKLTAFISNHWELVLLILIDRMHLFL